MNDKEKAVLDAARDVVRNRYSHSEWQDLNEAIFRLSKAVDAFPADDEPQPETVRDVADLRDGETVLLWGEEWQVKVYESGHRSLHSNGTFIGNHLVPTAIAAGAVTRPPRPEPDPADVERLTYLLLPIVGGAGVLPRRVAEDLLRSGQVTLREPS